MQVELCDVLQRKLEKVRKRDWWPATELARVLGRSRMFVYRRIDNGEFAIHDDGGEFIKVQSASVVNWFETRYDKYR